MMPARAASALSLFVFLASCTPRQEVPTAVVEATPFVQKVTAEGLLASKTVTSVAVPSEVRGALRLSWLAPDAAEVDTDDVVARFDSSTLEDNLIKGRSAHASAGYRVVQAESQATANKAGITTQLETSALDIALAQRFRQTEDDGVWSRNEVIASQIDEELALERRSHAESQLTTQERRVGSDLEILEIEQRKARFEIEEAETGLASLVVKSPHPGLFTRARDWRGEMLEVGQEVWRGREIGEIPDLSVLQAEVFVLEADAGGIVEGLEAEVVLEAQSDRIHAAKVIRVDAIAQPRRTGSPVQYFGVTLSLDATDPDSMKPGQRVAATIYLARRESALVIPRQAVSTEDGNPTVYLRQGSGFEPRPVVLGVGNRAQVEIAEGLSVGDVIALRPREARGSTKNEMRDTTRGAGPEAPDRDNKVEGVP
jgi:multidrug resistance efflux pump